MLCHCETYNRAPRLTFTDPCKSEVRPGARLESPCPAWLASLTMNASDTTKVYIILYEGLTLDVDQHYIGSVKATTHQEKGIIIQDKTYMSKMSVLEENTCIIYWLLPMSPTFLGAVPGAVIVTSTVSIFTVTCWEAIATVTLYPKLKSTSVIISIISK